MSTINIRVPDALKTAIQAFSKNINVPVGTMVNMFFIETVKNQRLDVNVQPLEVFNAKTAEEITQSLQDLKEGKNIIGPFDAASGMITELRSTKAA